MLHDQQWKCSMLFNEEEPTSKLPKIVNILDTLEKGVDYVFPQRFGGREAKNQVKVELKLAAIQAGFQLSTRSTKKDSDLIASNSMFSSYFVLGCTKHSVYRKNKRNSGNIRGIYKTRTKCCKDKNHQCPFVLSIGLRKSDNRWIIRHKPKDDLRLLIVHFKHYLFNN